MIYDPHETWRYSSSLSRSFAFPVHLGYGALWYIPSRYPVGLYMLIKARKYIGRTSVTVIGKLTARCLWTFVLSVSSRLS